MVNYDNMDGTQFLPKASDTEEAVIQTADGKEKTEDFETPKIARDPLMTPQEARIAVRFKIRSEAVLAEDTGLMKYILGIKIIDYAMAYCHPNSERFPLDKMRKELEFWTDIASGVPLDEAIRYIERAVDIFRDRAINQGMNARGYRENVGKQAFRNETEARLTHAAGECRTIEDGIAYQLANNEIDFSKDGSLTDDQKEYFQRVKEEAQKQLVLIKNLIPEDENNHAGETQNNNPSEQEI